MQDISIDSTGAARADRDHKAITDLGITTRSALSGGDGTATAFAHGTTLCDAGVQLAKRDRRAFERLPSIEDAMDALIARVQREERADHWADLGGCLVDSLGRVAPERDLETRAEIPRLVPSATGWARLAGFAPEGTPVPSNINSWAGKRRGDKVRLRTRIQPGTEDLSEAARDRQLWAVVSEGYVPYDIDAIAADIRRHLPSDAHARVHYDDSRMRVDAILMNPHHFPDSSGVATVGEAHRLTLRITSADDGTGGFSLRWSAERIRCINLTLLKGHNTVFRARHTREDLAEQINAALAVQGQVMDEFAQTWRAAWTSYYLDTSKRGPALDGLEALRRLVFHGMVRIPGLRKPDVWASVKSAWEAEPGDGGASVAAVHNAITRAAHQHEGSSKTWTPSEWATDDAEVTASDLLYQPVHVLNPIPEHKRDELAWLS